MKTYKIPHTDLEVSRLAYGTWHMGGSWDHTPLTSDLKNRAVELVETAVSLGINHIDLADIYTKGKSDAVIGHVLAQNPGLREKLVLQAKCGIQLGDEPHKGDPGRYNFDYDHIVGAVEGTLKRLGTDYVDLLALHRPDPLVEPEEVARAFEHLKSSGKVRYFGVSNHTASQIALLQKYSDQKIVLNQVEFNLLHHYLVSDGITANMLATPYAGVMGTLDYCRLHEIMIQAWSPVAGGQLFGPQPGAPDHIKAAAGEISRLAQKHQTTQEAIAVAWILRHPAGIQPIIGTLKPERLNQTAPADEIVLSRIEWYKLLAAARGSGVP